jgi:hypothetical protein
MATLIDADVDGLSVGSQLKTLLMADSIEPGSEASYQVCKAILTHHPLGMKMALTPVQIAMSMPRTITIPKSPESMVKEAFEREWDAIGADKIIENAMVISRAYGASVISVGAVDFPSNEPIPPKDYAKLRIFFNVLDPLNVAGSLVLNQDPNSPDFQKARVVSAAGVPYHFSRTCIMFNEAPVYLSFTSSAFGYSGRSVYQRALFPLKSFINSMIADDEIAKKCAVVVAKIKNPGSFADRVTGAVNAIKRTFIKDATNGNVINVNSEDTIETLDINNVDKAITTVRANIIENIAHSALMPPKLIGMDGYAGVFANGTEDFKQTMQYINGVRKDMRPLYNFLDPIVQRRAWSPEFYERIQAEFPAEYGNVSYEQAFYTWKNDFTAEWPNLNEEPESEQAKADKVKLDAIIQLVEKLAPSLDPNNASELIDWVQKNINSMKTLFSDPMEIDIDELKAFAQKSAQNPPEQTPPEF